MKRIVTNVANSLNEACSLREIASGNLTAISVLATGTVIAGKPKLTVSQDDINFYPLNDEDGNQVELTTGVPIYLINSNVYIKCDLTGVSSNDLIVTVQ